MENYRYGIDLGGTKIEGVVLSADGKVIDRRRLPTEQERGYDHIVGQVVRLVGELEAVSGAIATHVGIGTPGTIDPPTGLLKNSNTVVLNGRPLNDDLAATLGRPVILANDANCFAVAEARLGCVPEKVPGARVVFGVIMGTGVGGGLVVDGRILGGAQGIGGEWGHMFLDHAAGYCYCGRVGCVERLVAGPSVAAYYAKRAPDSPAMPEIVRRHRSGNDPLATETIDRWLDFFARGMANVINVLDPDVVVLGGGLSKVTELHTEGVARVAAHLFNPRMDTRFLQPRLGDSAGVFGAALLGA